MKGSLAWEWGQRLLRGEVELQPLSPEASSRRYFRPLAGDSGWLLVRSPQPVPLATTEWLVECGVRVPRLFPLEDGAYLAEDLGDRHLFQEPSLGAYRQMLADWRRFAQRPLPATHPNTGLALDTALFARELEMFLDYYLTRWRRAPAGAAELDALRRQCAALATAAAQGPWRVQHRDFHSRNVMLPASTTSPAWLDHQDLRPGPLFYDLASLLTDAYLDLPQPIRAFLEAAALEIGREAGLSAAESARRLRLSATQRVLKALGTFGRMLVDGRREYLDAERRARPQARALLEQCVAAGDPESAGPLLDALLR